MRATSAAACASLQSPTASRACGEISCNPASAFCPFSAERLLITTVAPPAASFSATRSPRPPDDPVTNATLPSNSIALTSFAPSMPDGRRRHLNP